MENGQIRWMTLSLVYSSSRSGGHKMTITRLVLPAKLRARRITGIKYDDKIHLIFIYYRGRAIIFSIIPDNIKKSIEIFYEAVEGIMDESTKKEVTLFFSENWGVYIFNSIMVNVCNDDINNDTKYSQLVTDAKSDIDLPIDSEIPRLPTKNYVDFVISTIKKTVKKEDTLIRQVLYTG